MTSNSIDELSELASELTSALQKLQEYLKAEGERVQREVVDYAHLNHTALAAIKTVIETTRAPSNEKLRSASELLHEAVTHHDSERPIQTERGRKRFRRSPRPSRIKTDPDHARDQKRAANYSADKIEIVTGTIWQTPSHAGKQAESFGEVGENHHCQRRQAQ